MHCSSREEDMRQLGLSWESLDMEMISSSELNIYVQRKLTGAKHSESRLNSQVQRGKNHYFVPDISWHQNVMLIQAVQPGDLWLLLKSTCSFIGPQPIEIRSKYSNNCFSIYFLFAQNFHLNPLHSRHFVNKGILLHYQDITYLSQNR